jgi:hypothetical protein
MNSLGGRIFFAFPTDFYFFLVIAVLTSIIVPRRRGLSLYRPLFFWTVAFALVSILYFFINGYDQLPNRTNNLNISVERINVELPHSSRHRPLTVLVIEPAKVSDENLVAYKALRMDFLQHFVNVDLGQLIVERARRLLAADFFHCSMCRN